jgi:AraC-like DNA-binding protein
MGSTESFEPGTGEKLREKVRFWRSPNLPGVEILRADYRAQSFSRHSHETFAFGVVERGGLAFQFRGAREVAGTGTVTLAFPGESHTGQGADRTGWSYRMFYADPSLLESAARQAAPDRRGMPPLLQGVISDPELAGALRRLHFLLEGGSGTPLEIQERFQAVLIRFVRRHARWDASPRRGRVDGPVSRARAYLEDRFAEPVSLDELALVAGCSPFRLTRAFREILGMPPHAWQLQLRIRRGQELLRLGEPASRVAAELGFADQSHFHRTFRRILGVTPGIYAGPFRPAPLQASLPRGIGA